jgi:hypothetical protein
MIWDTLIVPVEESMFNRITNTCIHVFIVAFFMYNFLRIVKTYRVRQTATAKYLLLMFFAYGLANVFMTLDGIFIDLYIIRYGDALSFLAAAFANVGLVYFATEVFYGKGEKPSKTIVLVRILFAMGEIAVCTWGALMKLLDMRDWVTTSLVLIFTISILLYFILAINAYKLARKLERNELKTSITYIGHFALSLLGIFVFYILDSFYIGYSIWIVIGTCFYAFATYLSYVGFVKPMKS